MSIANEVGDLLQTYIAENNRLKEAFNEINGRICELSEWVNKTNFDLNNPSDWAEIARILKMEGQ